MRMEISARLNRGRRRVLRRAEGRVRDGLHRWRRRLTRVRAFLSDGNGAGVSAHCRLVLETRRARAIVANGRGGDAEQALADALRRARLRMDRWSERRTHRARRREAA